MGDGSAWTMGDGSEERCWRTCGRGEAAAAATTAARGCDESPVEGNGGCELVNWRAGMGGDFKPSEAKPLQSTPSRGARAGIRSY
jgi:hypothetical protein